MQQYSGKITLNKNKKYKSGLEELKLKTENKKIKGIFFPEWP